MYSNIQGHAGFQNVVLKKKEKRIPRIRGGRGRDQPLTTSHAPRERFPAPKAPHAKADEASEWSSTYLLSLALILRKMLETSPFSHFIPPLRNHRLKTSGNSEIESLRCHPMPLGQVACTQQGLCELTGLPVLFAVQQA